MIQDSNTEQKIIATARKIFLERGFDGARMQDIADEAGINKALLHYYFRSKEKLFEIVFVEQMKKFSTTITPILMSELSVIEKIKTFIDKHTDAILESPKMPLFIMTEIAKNPQLFINRSRPPEADQALQNFFKQIKKEGKEGKIREVTPEFIWMNLMSLTIFPFIGMPMFMNVLKVTEEEYLKLIKKRKKEVTEFIVNALSVPQ